MAFLLSPAGIILLACFLGIPFFVHATTIGSDITTDNIIIEGNATVGNATSTDRVFLNARVASSIIPTTNNLLDIGEYERAWNNIYASGTLFASTTRVYDGTAQQPGYAFVKDGDTGFFGGTGYGMSGYIGVALDGSLDFYFRDYGPTSVFAPSSSGVHHLGNYADSDGDGVWGNVYASGTVYMGAGNIFNPTASSTLTITSGGAGLGGQIILKDSDGSGCSVMSLNNGTLTTAAITCP